MSPRGPGRSQVAAVLALVALLVSLAACVEDGTTTTGPSGSPATAPTGPATDDPATDAATGAATDAPTAAATDGATGPATDVGTDPVTDGATDPATGPVPTSTAEVVAEASGSQVFLVDARVAAQAGFDRVVWELAGDGVPGYRVGWTDDPRRDGSGDPVDLPGGATLQVVLVGVGLPPDAPAGTSVYDGPATLSASGTEVVTEVEVGTVFEGRLTGFVGAAERSPFSVTVLRDPTRVVVDVAH